MLKVGSEKPEKCFQCGRCTSGCTVSKIVKTYRPNKIVGFTRHGLVKNVLDRSIWNCARCLKCVEYCPQNVSPADLILGLQYRSISEGIEFPEAYKAMVENVSETGLAFKEMEVTDKDFETWSRISIGLPQMSIFPNLEKVSRIVSMIEKGEL